MKISNTPKPNLLIILGPTAVGKTELSIKLAHTLNGEVISADSRLFYRGMNIGTAKPTKDEMDGIPHHLIDVAAPDETWSLSVFKENAERLIQEITARGHLPIFVGGTGQYIRAITDGWQPPTVTPNQRLREILEKMAADTSTLQLHNKLAVLDPAAAASIDHRNVRRTIRALEVILQTGELFSKQRNSDESAYNCIFIGLIRPRAELYQRVDQRIENMFEAGLLAEVEGLLRNGYSSDLPSMSAIGYREAILVLNGSISLDEAMSEMKRITRVFIRRQANWFKADDPTIHWFNPSSDSVETIRETILRDLK